MCLEKLYKGIILFAGLLISHNSISQKDVFYSLVFHDIPTIAEARGFISLSETIGADVERTIYLEPRYLDHQGDRYQQVQTTNNHHELLGSNRKLLFEKLGIEESDSIFIYSLIINRVKSYSVKDLKTVAFLDSYYTFDHEVYQWYYQIGFEINDLMECDNKAFREALVSIGSTSPFIPQGLERIVLRDLEETERAELESMFDTLVIDQKAKIYNFENLTFLVLGKEDLSILSPIREIIIFDQNVKDIISHKVFETMDGWWPAPYGQQFTGIIIKDKPPVLMGFYIYSFGCPEISFLSSDQESIRIRCDNRH